jgi:hypothetical protein
VFKFRNTVLHRDPSRRISFFMTAQPTRFVQSDITHPNSTLPCLYLGIVGGK